MKRLGLILAALFLSASIVSAAQKYVTQAGAGSGDGSSLANAWSVSSFNASGTSAGADDIVHVSGTITSQIVIPNGGTSGHSITIDLSLANITAPVWAYTSNGAVFNFGHNYVTIDGGGTGIIQCTANGTGLANHTDAVGVLALNALSFVVKNLNVWNMYVRTSVTDENVGTNPCAAILNNASGSDISGFTVTGCYIHDVETGIDSDYGPGASNYLFSGNTIYNVNWGGRCGDRASDSTMTGLVVSLNTIYGFSNWNEVSPSQYHHNAFYAWAENGGTLTNPTFYKNKIGPGFGNSFQTAGIFVSCTNGTVSGITEYDNIFSAASGESVGNGLITNGGAGLIGTTLIANNTFIQGGSGNAIQITGGSSASALNLLNNVTNGNAGGTFMAIYFNGNLTISCDYDIGYNLNAAQAYSYSANGSSVFKTFSQWQGLGFETHGLTSNPVLDSNYQPASNSPALNAATNLTATFTTDFGGYIRPASGNWTIGAFQNPPGGTVTVTTATVGP